MRLSNVEESVIIPKTGSESPVAATCHDRESLKTTVPLLQWQKPAISPATTACSASIDLVMQFKPTVGFTRRRVIATDYKGHMMITCALQ